MASQSTGDKLTPCHREGDTAFFVADVDQFFDIDFSEYRTMFVNLVDASTLKFALNVVHTNYNTYFPTQSY